MEVDVVVNSVQDFIHRKDACLEEGERKVAANERRIAGRGNVFVLPERSELYIVPVEAGAAQVLRSITLSETAGLKGF